MILADKASARTPPGLTNRRGSQEKGNPPFTWEESAIDALRAYSNQSDWGLAHTILRLEGFNGWGSPANTWPTMYLTRMHAPQAIKIGVLINTTNQQNFVQARDAEKAAGQSAVKLFRVEVRSADALDKAFDTLVLEGAQAVLVLPDPMFSRERRRIANLALVPRLPTMYSERYNVDDGGLISYGYSRHESFRRAAALVDKLLKGTKPADLPVELPTKLELVINVKTAKALGLTFPPSLLVRADEVIE